MRFSIGQGPEPGAENTRAIDPFGIRKAMKSRAPLLGQDAGRMIRKSGENSHLMSHPDPMPRQLGGARGGRTHLWRKVLRHVEDLHDRWSTIRTCGAAKAAPRKTKVNDKISSAKCNAGRQFTTLVVEQFEHAFLDERAGTIGPPLRISFPTFCHLRKTEVTRQL